MPRRRGAPRAYWPCALVTLLWLPQAPAFACGSLPADMQRRLVAGDLRQQQALAATVAAEADAIVIADVVAVAPDDARVHVRQWIKGAGDAALQVAPANRLDAIGCLPSAEFRNVALRSGEAYLLYLAGGSVLRAGHLRRGPQELTLEQELAQVRGVGVLPATTEVR
ncbi:MAG: hypothetical protein FH747_10895 [Stenotrophomonas sp.]|uniref:hypothetical protein n=1 Tax=Stenotrophomonas sp. TaxID=69392 RepID=UPI001352A908|nr:hypothetical protein [Stenotrophomonas sp.]MTI74141.1 hypothetical protein [Stenotrophomonas sp.]